MPIDNEKPCEHLLTESPWHCPESAAFEIRTHEVMDEESLHEDLAGEIGVGLCSLHAMEMYGSQGTTTLDYFSTETSLMEATVCGRMICPAVIVAGWEQDHEARWRIDTSFCGMHLDIYVCDVHLLVSLDRFAPATVSRLERFGSGAS